MDIQRERDSFLKSSNLVVSSAESSTRGRSPLDSVDSLQRSNVLSTHLSCLTTLVAKASSVLDPASKKQDALANCTHVFIRAAIDVTTQGQYDLFTTNSPKTHRFHPDVDLFVFAERLA